MLCGFHPVDLSIAALPYARMLPEDRVSLADPSGVSQVEVDSNQFLEVGQLRMCNPRLERLLAIANSKLGCLQQSNSGPKMSGYPDYLWQGEGWCCRSQFVIAPTASVECTHVYHNS